MAESKHTERVLLTGISGALGNLIAHRLHNKVHLIGADKRAFPDCPKNVELYSLDLRRKSAYQLLKKKKPHTIIHIGVIRNPKKHKGRGTAYYFNVETTNQLLRLAEDLNVKKFIFLSTANLYGPSSTSSSFLSEDAPLHGANRSPEVRDLVALDMMIQSFFWKQPTIETIILRPVHIVGQHLNNAPSNYLRLRTVPTLLGYDPLVQLVHEQDVVSAIENSLKPGVRGIFNIIGKGQAPISRLLNALEANVIPVPEQLLRMWIKTAFGFNFTTFLPGEIDHLKYTCLVDGARAEAELDYQPAYGLMDTISDLISGNLQNAPS